MARLLACLSVCAAVIITLGPRSDARPQDGNAPDSSFPAGKWRVEFTNGVTELCDVFRFNDEGHAAVEEPLRRARGSVAVNRGSAVMTFHDDRVERWTPVGKRYVVEHWFPASQFATGTPVLGIAERVP